MTDNGCSCCETAATAADSDAPQSSSGRLLREAILRLPRWEQAALLYAYQQKRSLVTEETFPPSVFVQCEGGDIQRAARRMTAYWRWRWQLFYEDDDDEAKKNKNCADCHHQHHDSSSMIMMRNSRSLFLEPLRLISLPVDLQALLKTGFISFLPDDAMGRPVVCFDASRLTGTGTTSSTTPLLYLRATFYLWSVLCLHEQQQRKQQQQQQQRSSNCCLRTAKGGNSSNSSSGNSRSSSSSSHDVNGGFYYVGLIILQYNSFLDETVQHWVNMILEAFPIHAASLHVLVVAATTSVSSSASSTTGQLFADNDRDSNTINDSNSNRMCFLQQRTLPRAIKVFGKLMREQEVKIHVKPQIIMLQDDSDFSCCCDYTKELEPYGLQPSGLPTSLGGSLLYEENWNSWLLEQEHSEQAELLFETAMAMAMDDHHHHYFSSEDPCNEHYHHHHHHQDTVADGVAEVARIHESNNDTVPPPNSNNHHNFERNGPSPTLLTACGGSSSDGTINTEAPPKTTRTTTTHHNDHEAADTTIRKPNNITNSHHLLNMANEEEEEEEWRVLAKRRRSCCHGVGAKPETIMTRLEPPVMGTAEPCAVIHAAFEPSDFHDEVDENVNAATTTNMPDASKNTGTCSSSITLESALSAFINNSDEQTKEFFGALEEARQTRESDNALNLVEKESPWRRFLYTKNGRMMPRPVDVALHLLAKWWNVRKQLFGKKFLQPMTQTGEGALGRKEIAVLRSEHFMWLPDDTKGRVVLYLDLIRALNQFDECIVLRCLFYALHVACEDTTVGSLIVLCPFVDSVFPEWKSGIALTQLWEMLPVSLIAIHFVHDEPSDTVLQTLNLDKLRRFYGLQGHECEIFIHRATSTERLLLDLQSQGFSKECLPVRFGGDFGGRKFFQYLELRVRVEWDLPAGTRNNSVLHMFDFSKVKQLADLSDVELVERKRRMNILHARRKRDREQMEESAERERCHLLTKENARLKEDNARLELMLDSAKAEMSKQGLTLTPSGPFTPASSDTEADTRFVSAEAPEVPPLASSPRDREAYKRAMNRLYSQRKRERERDTINSLVEECNALYARNRALLVDNIWMQDIVHAALAEVSRHESTS